MNLGDFIKELKKIPSSALVVIKHNETNFYLKIVEYHDYLYSEHTYPMFFHSYRGYYKDLAISIGKKETVHTVDDLLIASQESINFPFEGYKGGIFTMDKKSELWFSKWGEASGYKFGHITQSEDCIYIHLIEFE